MHNHSSFTNEQDERSAAIEVNGRDRPEEELGLTPETGLPAGVFPTLSLRRPQRRKQLTLIAVVISLLLAMSALLLPILLAQPGQLATTSHPSTAATLVGRVSFTSSGQLNLILPRIGGGVEASSILLQKEGKDHGKGAKNLERRV